MQSLVLIALGGAIGALLRFLVSSGMHSVLGRGFPYGTLAVNVLGSLAMGFAFAILVEREQFPVEYRALLMVGVLGAFTTFSTFSFETLELLENGAFARALANVLVNVTLCLAVCWAGLLLGRQVS
ncbi:MAG: fluoride efflux transporter CrcB [Gammaproteobacteria bacterium]|nr:fluoride efflux transporter CrcB [Gammaproteobacteria bacterium]